MPDFGPLFRLAYRAAPAAIQIRLKGRRPPGTTRFRLRLPGGEKLVFHGLENAVFLRQLFWNGFDGVNPEFTRIFQAMAKSANSVIDLGSYLGYYSLIAAKMNPSARVFSVEPLPDSIAYQKQLFKFNGADNVQICPVGVAMKSATVPFYVPDRSLSRIPNIGSLTNRFGPGTFYEDRGSDTIHTEVLTLPDLVQKYEIPQIELIKFFVEDMEVDIFAGGKSILANWNPDLFGWIFYRGDSVKKLGLMLADLGTRFSCCGGPAWSGAQRCQMPAIGAMSSIQKKVAVPRSLRPAAQRGRWIKFAGRFRTSWKPDDKTMCGIVALFLNRPLSPADVTMGDQATFDLRHRGPDASGEWVDRKSGIFFGHRRLTVIDLTDASSQPMVLGEHVVTYNGENYNYRDLRERLRGLGQSFSTQGDTEVLMTAWRHFGPKALDSIEGMFAFALWDGRDGWTAPDRFGEKQLFYATTQDGIAAASELPTLARMVGATQNISHEETAAFLSLGYIPGPGTVYPSIRRMPPATILRISGGKIIDQRRYWRPPFGEPGHGPVEPISENGSDRIQAVLVDSVSLRLEADAPSCLYLSSGTDSSLVAAISARSLGRKLDAITVRFSTGNAHDETADAQTIASEIGLPHHIVENQDEATAVNPEFFSNLIGQPTDDLTLASLHQMARAGAGRGFKVGLTGLGGDEVVFGYNKHAFIFEHRRILNSPEWLRRWLGHVVGAIGGRTSKAQTHRETVKVRDFERYIAVKNFPTIRALREVPGFDRWASRNFAPTRRRLEFEVPVFEFEGVMTGHRLPSTDAGSMRASMEFRTPFLSRALQETIAEFDPRALMKFGQKSVFRRLLKRYLPDQMVDLPKRGFVFPSDRFEWVGRDRAPPTKLVPRELVEQIWRNRSKPGWRALATRIAMLSEFENWVPGRLPQNPGQTKPAEPAASAAS